MSYNGNDPMRTLKDFFGGSIINIVCALEIMGVLLYLFAPEFLINYMILNPRELLSGQIWRIVTFLVWPPAIAGSDAITFVLFNALGLYCVRAFGLIVEQVWGKFRFNCYIISGVLAHALVAVFFYLVFGYSMILTPSYLVYSFFFVFALTFPNLQVRFMMVLPLKASWIAAGEALIYIYSFVTGGLVTRVEIFINLVLIGAFFAWMTISPVRTVVKKSARTKKFETKIKAAKAARTGHRCAVCGLTDKDNPSMEFRYCSKCEGDYEYCMDHLYTHQHVRREEQ